ncbi:MAG: hypothetical protein ACM34F_06260 [Betaproteobacteria bacterium]
MTDPAARGQRDLRKTAVKRMIVIQSAHQIDVGRGDGRLRKLVADHQHQFCALVRRRQPSEIACEIDQPRPQCRAFAIAQKVEIAASRLGIGLDCSQRARDIRRLPRGSVERRGKAFESVEEHTNLGHVAAEQSMNGIDLLRRCQAIVDKLADVAPGCGVRIAVAKAAGQGERPSGKVADDTRAGAARANFVRAARLQVTVEIGRRQWTQWGYG